MKKYLFAFCTLVMPLLSMAQLPVCQSISDVRFIEGGIGLDESESMKMEAKNWPLLIEFSHASGSKSEWVSDVFLVVKDSKGFEVVAHQVDGPLILLDLKPGRYSVESTYDGQKKMATFYIEAGQHKTVDISWR